MNNLHERALRVVHYDENSFYSELLLADNERTIHQHVIKILMRNICNFENDLSPTLIDDMFQVWKTTLNKNLKICKNGSGDNILPCTSLVKPCSSSNQRISSLSTFKEKEKLWHCDNYSCRLTKTYIANFNLSIIIGTFISCFYW